MRTATKDTLTGNLACFTAYLIFGFNIIFCKNIANDGNVSPMSLFLLRSAGALLLFCIASTVTRTKERVEVRDLWKIALASMLGLFLTQFSFLEAITMTTAVDASVLSLMTPVMTMIVAAIALRDRITAHGSSGSMPSSARGPCSAIGRPPDESGSGLMNMGCFLFQTDSG